MMTEREYVDLMVGKPYLQGSDCLTNGGIDCFGVIKDKFQCCLGVIIQSPSERIDIAEGGEESLNGDEWSDVKTPQDADIFTCYNSNNDMVHCGLVVFDGKSCLHAVGDKDEGQVMLWPVRKLLRFYGLSGGTIKFHKYNHPEG